MKKFLFGFLMVAVLLTACGKEDAAEKELTHELTHELAQKGILMGKLKDKLELKPGTGYTLTGNFIVEKGGELHIPAGTVIKANEGFGNYILVLQDGKIFVNGTAEKPVTMTANVANAQQGHWGGLIINGRAPLAGGTTGSTEINAEYKYGGTNAADNSGMISYLKLEYTGSRNNANVEHNGLTLNGVGNGTKIENIFIPNGADDGIEFFGGTVNVKNLLVVNSDDDMFDFTQGYAGTLENCYGIWEAGYSSSESDPCGVEADGNLDGKFPTQSGQSDFTIKNMTIDLKLAPIAADHADFKKKSMLDVIKIRRGAKATITNALVKGTGSALDLVDFTDGKGAGNPASSVDIKNSLTNPLIGKEKNGEGTLVTTNNNAGCPTDIFSWTGYKF